jgi:hypothetical protein
MEGKTYYIADDFDSINKYLKKLEGALTKAPAKYSCLQCADAGFVRSSYSGKWKICPGCINHQGKPVPLN